MIRNWLSTKHHGVHELAGLVVLYGVYEVVRGFGDQDVPAALAHTDRIVALERAVGVYVEQGVQSASQRIDGLPALLGVLYMVLHFLGTAAVITWVHRRRPDAYPVVRTTLIVSTALALIGYVLFPAAPPRLANLGFLDTVTDSTGINLSSDLLGSLYNPIAAVPSLHFGYAAIVGAALATLARSRTVRLLGVAYPALMLFIIVATGNHFIFDAAAGGLTVLVAWLVARVLVRPARETPAQPVVRPETVSWFSACLMRCSSCQRSAVDSPATTRSSSAFAASSCAWARASSISATDTASSTRASARSVSTLKNPGPVANSSTSVPPRWTRVDPAFSVATSGAWRARTPISPAAPGTMSILASPSNTGPSGVTSETSNVGCASTSAIVRYAAACSSCRAFSKTMSIGPTM